MAWVISRPLGVGACAVGNGTTQTAAAAASVKLAIVTLHHYNTHTVQGHHSVKAIHKLSVDSHALSMHRSRVLVHRQIFITALYASR